MERDAMSAIEDLRGVVRLFDGCREGFNERFSAPQLIKLWRAYKASDWDYAPDQWTPRQVREALRGIPPQWDEDCKPKHTPRKRA
jgi:hypothetical protein